MLLDIWWQDHLSWPYQLESVVVVLDGAVLYYKSDRLERTIEVAHLAGVARGEHVLQLMAKVSYSTGSIDDRCLLTLRKATPFTLSDRALSLRLDAHAGDVTRSFSDRVRVDVLPLDSAEGSASTPSSPGADPNGCD